MRRVAWIVVTVLSILLMSCTQQHLAPITSINVLDEQPAISHNTLHVHEVIETRTMPEVTSPLPAHLQQTQPPAIKVQNQAAAKQKQKTILHHDVPRVPVPAFYIVEPGDTLGGIAHYFGLSYLYLAKLNQIDKTYTIHVSQVLKLKGKIPPQSSKKTASPIVTSVTSAVSSLQPTPNASQTRTVDKITWSWPAQGKVQNQFNPQGDVFHHGLDIIGQDNTQVYAAAQGKVLFSGLGAKGYGQMIILQNSNGYLTAYSQLSQIKIKEGEQVQRGQQIAKMGKVGGHVQMHFEVRHHGQPVNPLKYLTKESVLHDSV